MKKIKLHYFSCCLLLVLFCGCYGIPKEHDYIGMTKAEVAAHLEKHAFRDRWSGNKFEIEVIQKQAFSRNYKNSKEVTSDKFMMSANEWRCDFFPRRHWLLGWDGIFSKWHFVNLKFRDGRVVNQQNLRNYYWVRGHAGKSPYPNYPENFHKVNENIFRSGQPDHDEFESLCTFDRIRSVLNLRENDKDKKMIDTINNKHYAPKITLYELPLDTGNITEGDRYKLLTIIRDAPKPLLIHCWLGSNRTGCAVAAYRIVFENWSVEDAISELKKPEYGHYKIFYSNIPELLCKADWKKIKAVFNVQPFVKR